MAELKVVSILIGNFPRGTLRGVYYSNLLISNNITGLVIFNACYITALAVGPKRLAMPLR